MQVFRLVNGGSVDAMIAFDTLPERIMKNIRSKGCEGLPRYWAKFLTDHGSVREIVKCVETTKDANNNYYYKYEKLGMEPCCFVLDYKDINNDKEKWQEISNYVRRAVNVKTRLMDKLEDMAKPMAPDSYTQLELEPEDIPVIVVPLELNSQKDPAEIIKPGEDLFVEAPKKRGRPKKVAVEA